MNTWNPCIWSVDLNNFSVNDFSSYEHHFSSTKGKAWISLPLVKCSIPIGLSLKVSEKGLVKCSIPIGPSLKVLDKGLVKCSIPIGQSLKVLEKGLVKCSIPIGSPLKVLGKVLENCCMALFSLFASHSWILWQSTSAKTRTSQNYWIKTRLKSSDPQ